MSKRYLDDNTTAFVISSQFINYLSPHLLSDNVNTETGELQGHKTLNVNSSDISFVVNQNRVYVTFTHMCFYKKKKLKIRRFLSCSRISNWWL